MKALIALIAITVLAQTSFAASKGEAEVTIQTEAQAPHAEILITGKAAELLYKSLNVQSQRSFGLVQSSVKTTDTVECTRSMLGDVPQPGKELPTHYACTVFVNL